MHEAFSLFVYLAVNLYTTLVRRWFDDFTQVLWRNIGGGVFIPWDSFHISFLTDMDNHYRLSRLSSSPLLYLPTYPFLDHPLSTYRLSDSLMILSFGTENVYWCITAYVFTRWFWAMNYF
jgi:hypothetical protein